MTKIQYYAAASLDGYIAEADDSIDWLEGYDGTYEGAGAEPLEGRYDEFYGGVGANVMGSATYEFLLDHISGGGRWPYADKPSWVLTSRELPVAEGHEDVIHIASGPIADLHPEIVAAAGDRNVWVVGGGNVASQYADAGLLDELIVTVVPVVLGTGKPLFETRLPGKPLQLTGTRPFGNGMVELTYAIGG